MTQLETLASVAGRALLRDIFRELRFERQLGAVATFSVCWRICTTERELVKLTRREVVILHPLGIWSGTALWMQEIVNRFAYSAINAFVYFGAAILLVAVGLNRTGIIDSPGIIVAGIVLEALLLVVLFVVMFFAPVEDADPHQSAQNNGAEELIREMGEIGRDYAAMAVQLETISGTLSDLADRQDAMVASMKDSVQAAVNAVSPNPELLSAMRGSTAALERFAEQVNEVTDRLVAVERIEVERMVRAELERMLSRSILDSNERTSTSA